MSHMTGFFVVSPHCWYFLCGNVDIFCAATFFGSVRLDCAQSVIYVYTNQFLHKIKCSKCPTSSSFLTLHFPDAMFDGIALRSQETDNPACEGDLFNFVRAKLLTLASDFIWRNNTTMRSWYVCRLQNNWGLQQTSHFSHFGNTVDDQTCGRDGRTACGSVVMRAWVGCTILLSNDSAEPLCVFCKLKCNASVHSFRGLRDVVQTPTERATSAAAVSRETLPLANYIWWFDQSQHWLHLHVHKIVIDQPNTTVGLLVFLSRKETVHNVSRVPRHHPHQHLLYTIKTAKK